MTATTPETDPEYQVEDQDYVRIPRANIKELEAKAKGAATAQRELAFYKAGINPDSDPKLAYFMKGYEGEMNADAIKAAATDAGFLAAPVSDGSAEAAQRVADAASNKGTPAPSIGDKQKEYAEALATGGPEGLAEVVAKYGPVVGRNV